MRRDEARLPCPLHQSQEGPDAHSYSTHLLLVSKHLLNIYHKAKGNSEKQETWCLPAGSSLPSQKKHLPCAATVPGTRR